MDSRDEMLQNENNCNMQNTEEFDQSTRGILLKVIKDVSKDMDLTRVTLPVCILEPRSMLERITDFMAHPELVTPVSNIEDDTKRFIAVVKWWLSGWHIKPKGVKKPYNPILGEYFRCRYTYEDGTRAYYFSEQVSHHPPASAYFYTCPEHKVTITGDLHPKSRFYGNSVGSLMRGTINFILPERNNETYIVTMPNMYAKNIAKSIVSGSAMTLELGDASQIRCPSTGLVCDLEFTTKGVFSGEPNSVVGKITNEKTKEVLYEISGQWTNKLYITKYTPKEGWFGGLRKKPSEEDEDLLVDVSKLKQYPFEVPGKQGSEESRELWANLTECIKSGNIDKGDAEKSKVEEAQRVLKQEREDKNIKYNPRFFDVVDDEKYTFKEMNKVDCNNPVESLKSLDILFNN